MEQTGKQAATAPREREAGGGLVGRDLLAMPGASGCVGGPPVWKQTEMTCLPVPHFPLL